MLSEEYLSPDFCLHCAYFQQTKGHFGICTIINNVPYDGSTKGKSCSAWRIRTDKIIPFLTMLQRREEIKPVRGIPEDQYYKSGASRLHNKILHVDSMTEDAMRFGRFKYHYDLIIRATTLFSDGKNTRHIMDYLKEYANVNIDRKTIREWVFQILGAKAWYDAHRKESTPCIYCSSKNTVKNGKTKNKSLRYRCKSCKKDFYQ